MGSFGSFMATRAEQYEKLLNETKAKLIVVEQDVTDLRSATDMLQEKWVIAEAEATLNAKLLKEACFQAELEAKRANVAEAELARLRELARATIEYEDAHADYDSPGHFGWTCDGCEKCARWAAAVGPHNAATANEPCRAAGKPPRRGIYTASRVARAEMWRTLRDGGVHVTASWIDEAGEGQTGDLGELWERILREVRSSERLVLYAETDDFPLKGAFVEAGMALAAGVPVTCVLPGVALEPRSLRPLGSWARHPLVSFAETIEAATGKPPGGDE